MRSDQLHSAENAAIREGLQTNDPSMGGEVIKQVLSLLYLQYISRAPHFWRCESLGNSYYFMFLYLVVSTEDVSVSCF